ncbi:response regulator [Halovenus sp. WSH3]|uniref:Response regulator n=1 Tax=Halovenus carboxidivorans TaxID=2692199 RepID=A0A6B0T2J9_9EURY|nr:response regulator [Halovenus carboxidivorans]MXR52294.1 response regulator [Halovenus carboxidivorans]
MSETAEEDLPVALLVDDEKEVADAYALRLRGLCDIETVYDGQAALEQIEDDEIDILLLDRHMPGMSGDEVLERLPETGFSGRVIMVTAIDPGFDVLDMPFDDYLCKPVDREDIRDAVSQQCTVLGYETLGEYFSAASKRSVIETELPEEKRANHEEYQAVVERTERLRERATRLLSDAEELFETFEGIEREGR